MKWPAYFNERLWLVNPKGGFVGVATLWTSKEKIAPLMPEKVAVVGQLYTSAGIEFIIRNLWANPRISCLVICGADRTESGQALVEFFRNGTIDGKASLFENQIPKRALRTIREKVKLVDLRGEVNSKVVSQRVSKLGYRLPFAKKPRLFPRAESPETFPSEASVFRVEGKTIGETWLQILKLVLRFGRRIPRVYVYGGYERTLLNLAAVLTEEDIREPKIWPFFGFSKKDLRQYFKSFFSPKRGSEAYTYGERLFAYASEGKMIDQVSKMVKKLRSFPYNKGAIATLWQPQIDNFPIRKPWRTPCLTLVQGFCLEEELHLTAYFRSNDMFGAWPQNAFALRKLQAEIANKIEKKVGHLTTISYCAFIDESDLARAERIVRKNRPLFCQLDQRGNLSIAVERKNIIVRHFSPEGKLLAEFRQKGQEKKAALKLAQKLLTDDIISRVDHALDIGEQLGRAEDAVKLGLKFEQDQELKKDRV